jgi:hypothetical protein
MNSNRTTNRATTAHEPFSTVEAPRAAKKTRAQIQQLQRRVVQKLGQGDEQQGWLVFGGMATHERKVAESLDASGRLDRDAVASILERRR